LILNKKKLQLEFHLEKMNGILQLLLHHLYFYHRPRRPPRLNNLMILNIELEPTFRFSRH
jgi:hypothetical protein